MNGRQPLLRFPSSQRVAVLRLLLKVPPAPRQEARTFLFKKFLLAAPPSARLVFSPFLVHPRKGWKEGRPRRPRRGARFARQSGDELPANICEVVAGQTHRRFVCLARRCAHDASPTGLNRKYPHRSGSVGIRAERAVSAAACLSSRQPSGGEFAAGRRASEEFPSARSGGGLSLATFFARTKKVANYRRMVGDTAKSPALAPFVLITCY
jgi:hypothetical protein